MRWVLYLIPVWFMLALLTPMVRVLGGAYRRFRGQRPVTCPETNQLVSIRVNPRHAVAMAALGNPILRLQDCARWPERQGCGRGCLQQIA